MFLEIISLLFSPMQTTKRKDEVNVPNIFRKPTFFPLYVRSTIIEVFQNITPLRILQYYVFIFL